MLNDNWIANGLSRQEAEQEKGEAAWHHAFEKSLDGLEYNFQKQSDDMDLLFWHSEKTDDTRQFGERLMAVAFLLKKARSDYDFKKASDAAKSIIYDMAEYQADKAV